MPEQANSDGAGPVDRTSLHVRRALAGERGSMDWIVEHFTPLLRLQAEYRLRGALRGWCEPDDLVHEVWLVTLPRLPSIVARDGRFTPVLLRFLSTTLLHKANAALRSSIRGERPRRESSGGVGTGLAEGLSGQVTTVISQVVRSERNAMLRHAIATLEPRDREILILRGIEQLRNQDVAERLGLAPAAVSMRLKRALERLRAALPGTLLDDLDPDSTES